MPWYYMLIYYMIFRCSFPIWDDHPYRLSNKKHGEIIGCRLQGMDQVLHGNPIFGLWTSICQRFLPGFTTVPRYQVFTHSHENILLDTHGLWHEFCLLVLEVIACYNPLTSSWNHHSSSILDGCWCLNRVHSLCLMGKHGQTTMFQHVEGFNIFN